MGFRISSLFLMFENIDLKDIYIYIYKLSNFQDLLKMYIEVLKLLQNTHERPNPLYLMSKIISDVTLVLIIGAVLIT